MSDETLLPQLIARANRLVYHYAEGSGIDFEPFHQFLSAEKTERWFQAWTGNPAADGSQFRVFGQDGSGGYAALWTVRPDTDLLEQPVVFMGSEGETAVVARSFHDYLWLLAAGLGPCEAASVPEEPRIAQPQLAQFATMNAAPGKSAHEVMEDAKREFPNFPEFIEAQCR